MAKYVVVEGISLGQALENWRDQVLGTIIGYTDTLVGAQQLGQSVNCPFWIFNLEEGFGDLKDTLDKIAENWRD